MATWNLLNADDPLLARTAISAANKNISFNVTDHGAVGDGVTDDTAAVQSAITAADAAGGGIAFLPRGTYLVSSSLVMTNDNTTLQGAGRSATVIKTVSDAPIIKWQTASNLCVRDLQLLGDGDSGKTNQRGIEVTTADGGLIHNVHAKNLGYDGILLLNGSVRNTVSNCIVEGSQDDGINIGGGSLAPQYDNVIIGNTVLGSANVGIHISNYSSFTTVTGNTVYDCGEDGINTFQTGAQVGLGNHTIIGNTIRDCTQFGILIRDSDYNTVMGNNVSGGLRSLRAENTSYTQFVANNCSGASIGGFLDDVDCSDLTVSGNSFSGTFSHIFLVGPRAVVQGNSVRGATGANFASIYTATTVTGSVFSSNILSSGYMGVHVIGPDCVVSGNSITDMSNHGIRVDSTATDCVVSANSLKTITSNGVYLNSATRAQVVGNKINAANKGITITAGVDCHVADNYTVASVADSISENGASSATTVVHNRFDSTTVVNGTGSVLIKATESSAYTPTNVSTDRAYDANSTTTDELADVLGTLIADLQANGIIG